MKQIFYPYRWSILLISGLSIINALLLVSVAVVMKYVIDSAINGENIFYWSALLVLNLSAIIVVYTLNNWLCSSKTDQFAAKLRYDLMHSAIYSKDSKLQSYHSGELLSRAMEDVATVCDGAMNSLPALLGQIARLVGSFIAVLIIQPTIAVVLVGLVILMGVTGAVLRIPMKRQQRQVRAADEKVMSGMQENLQQLELLQSLQVQPQALERLHKRIKESLRKKFIRRCWITVSNSGIAIVSYASTGVVVIWGAIKLIAGAITYGDLASVMELLALFRGPVLGVSGLWTRLAAVEVACERLMNLLDIPTDEPKNSEQEELNVTAVVFENVTFAYSGEETAVVENFSASFPLTGWTCLTGISGKGKTTLFKLMLGLYTPQQGRVYLKTTAGEIDCSEQTRHLFAYVPQDYAMLSGTVLENLQLVVPDVTEETYTKALELADAGFIWDTAAGVLTHLGENNTGLSKGQLQRLAIARAILMDRKIFLLDECTSALDAQTEDTVLRNLKGLNKSAILVTHRPQAVEELKNVTFVPMDQ